MPRWRCLRVRSASRSTGMPVVVIGLLLERRGSGPGQAGAAPPAQRQPSVSANPGHGRRRYARPMLRVQLLGGFAADRDGTALVLPVAPARLLAYLALHPGSHDRDAVAERFWPDSP